MFGDVVGMFWGSGDASRMRWGFVDVAGEFGDVSGCRGDVLGMFPLSRKNMVAP